jgi:hypothetical protein
LSQTINSRGIGFISPVKGDGIKACVLEFVVVAVDDLDWSGWRFGSFNGASSSLGDSFHEITGASQLALFTWIKEKIVSLGDIRNTSACLGLGAQNIQSRMQGAPTRGKGGSNILLSCQKKQKERLGE